VITSGTNRRQVQAISDGVVEQLKKNGTLAARVEGYKPPSGILVDYGDFIVHVFDERRGAFTTSSACGAKPCGRCATRSIRAGWIFEEKQ